MSHFYGTLNGSRGEATRCGTRNSGMSTYCASWDGAIRCHAYEKELEDGTKEDWVRVEKVPWHGAGERKTLYHGKIGAVQDV